MSDLDGGSLLGSRGDAIRGGEMAGAAVCQNGWRQVLSGVRTRRSLPRSRGGSMRPQTVRKGLLWAGEHAQDFTSVTRTGIPVKRAIANTQI